MIVRYLRTGGALGHIPTWYRVTRAAKWAGVAPWDLAGQHAFWLSAIEETMMVESRLGEQRGAGRGNGGGTQR
jgi:hypothetical protein